MVIPHSGNALVCCQMNAKNSCESLQVIVILIPLPQKNERKIMLSIANSEEESAGMKNIRHSSAKCFYL